MTHQVAQHSEARNRVLNAAYNLFLKVGLSAATMQQIADDAGITKATLYHHFRDKHDLYLATMRLAITRNETALTQKLDGADTLRSLIRELIGYVFGDDRADLQRLALDFRLHVDADIQEQFWQEFQLPWKLVQCAIEGVDDITEDEAIHLSRYIYGAASGLSQLYRFEQEQFPVNDEVLDVITDSILYGIKPNQSPR